MKFSNDSKTQKSLENVLRSCKHWIYSTSYFSEIMLSKDIQVNGRTPVQTQVFEIQIQIRTLEKKWSNRGGGGIN